MSEGYKGKYDPSEKIKCRLHGCNKSFRADYFGKHMKQKHKLTKIYRSKRWIDNVDILNKSMCGNQRISHDIYKNYENNARMKISNCKSEEQLMLLIELCVE
jgi:hypothetical protein